MRDYQIEFVESVNKFEPRKGEIDYAEIDKDVEKIYNWRNQLITGKPMDNSNEIEESLFKLVELVENYKYLGTTEQEIKRSIEILNAEIDPEDVVGKLVRANKAKVESKK